MRTDAHHPDPDGFYEAWLDALAGLDAERAADLNARLVLLLANQVESPQVLLDCIAEAARTGTR
jgi:protein tyrosine phosphatase